MPKRSKAKTVGFHMQINSGVSVKRLPAMPAHPPAAKKAAKICKHTFFCLKPFSVVYIIIVNKIAGHKYGKKA